jgi:hypothetical protein
LKWFCALYEITAHFKARNCSVIRPVPWTECYARIGVDRDIGHEASGRRYILGVARLRGRGPTYDSGKKLPQTGQDRQVAAG